MIYSKRQWKRSILEIRETKNSSTSRNIIENPATLKTTFIAENAGFLEEIANDPAYWIGDTGASTQITTSDKEMEKIKSSWRKINCGNG